MRIKFLVLGLAFGALLGVGASMRIEAQQGGGNVTGWAWGGSTDALVGTSPANCGLNAPAGTANPSLCAPNPEQNATGVGWISLSSANPLPPPFSASTVPYGITIPAGDGPVRGYAWSSTLGWIHFEPNPPYPSANCGNPCPTTPVRRAGDGLVGWARIISIPSATFQVFPNPPQPNAGGFEGWIRFAPDWTIGGATSAGVRLIPASPAAGEYLRGYAWSNEFGWIYFDGMVGAPLVPPGTVTPPTGGPGGGPPGGGPGGGGPGPGTTQPPSSVQCLPSSQVVLRNQFANFSASGGNNVYSWSAPNSTNLTGTGATFQTAYTATGTFQVIVTSGGVNDSCSVSVVRIIEVPP